LFQSKEFREEIHAYRRHITHIQQSLALRPHSCRLSK